MAKDFSRPKRVWINQPSTLQPDHNLHGKYGIALAEKGDTDVVTIYFTEGPVHSRRISTLALEICKISSAG